MITIDFKLADTNLESSEDYLLKLRKDLSWDFEVIFIVCVVVWEANKDSTSISSLNLVLNALMAVSHVGFCVKFSVTFIHSGDFSESGQGSYFMQIYFLMLIVHVHLKLENNASQ